MSCIQWDMMPMGCQPSSMLFRQELILRLLLRISPAIENRWIRLVSPSIGTERSELWWTQWTFIQLFEHYYDKKADKALPIAQLVNHFFENGSDGVNPRLVTLMTPLQLMLEGYGGAGSTIAADEL